VSELRIGISAGALARARALPVAERLGAELVVEAGLRDALLAGGVDAVIHAFAELPSAPPTGLALAAVPRRGDARDVLCARDGLTLETLPEGARIGAGPALRRAQLLARRPDLEVVEVHGDVDLVLGRLGGDDRERLDAVVLGAASLDALGRVAAATEFLDLGDWPTAPAQGALAIETRVGEQKSVAKLDHRSTRIAVEAERGVLARLAHAVAPVAATAFLEDGMMFLSGRVYAPDGSGQVTASHALYVADAKDPAGELAARVADELLESGAAGLAS
jgi:Porphobilinogen deaminase